MWTKYSSCNLEELIRFAENEDNPLARELMNRINLMESNFQIEIEDMTVGLDLDSILSKIGEKVRDKFFTDLKSSISHHSKTTDYTEATDTAKEEILNEIKAKFNLKVNNLI